MLRVLVINESAESTIEEELKKTINNLEVLVTSSYKEGMKYILKYGDKINLALLNDNISDEKNTNILNILEVNNIKTIIICENIKNLPINLVVEKDFVIDCIIHYDDKSIKNVVNSANRILKNLDKNILVVDDSKIQLSILTKILTKMNLNVTTANDGLEALSHIEKDAKKFDLILTDYNMPNMDGLELTLKIRENYDKDELGIIILSSNNEPEVAAQFLKIGASDFINKPYNEIEVLTRINSNLDLIELFTKTKDMANKDFLTGAYNRRYFFEVGNMILKKARRNNENIALAMIDIDKFKNINDTYGHDVGDKVICEVCNVLNIHLRESDLMARFGGEEFCIIIDNVSVEDAMKLFDKIRIELSEHIIELESGSISFTASIGIYHGLEGALDDMIKISDNGLYYCKENGRNQIKMQLK